MEFTGIYVGCYVAVVKAPQNVPYFKKLNFIEKTKRFVAKVLITSDFLILPCIVSSQLNVPSCKN